MGSATPRSVLAELRDVSVATQLIQFGARMQVLEGLTNLSRAKLLALYREVAGRAPSKGQLPYSEDWFTRTVPNAHASLFFNLYQQLAATRTELNEAEKLLKSYQMYWAEVSLKGDSVALDLDDKPILTITRAWTLVRFMASGQLKMKPCSGCGGRFVTLSFGEPNDFVCTLCKTPSRAGHQSKRTAKKEREPFGITPFPKLV